MKNTPKTTFVINPNVAEKADTENYYVVKHNDLIQKVNYNRFKTDNQSLTLLEQKMLLLIISKIQPNDTEFKECKFTLSEIASLFGIDTTTSSGYYSNIKEVITGLASKVVWIDTPQEEITAHLISKAKIKKGTGIITIQLDDDLKRYLLNLYSHYTQYSLKNVIKIKSKYGIMLYELLKSYEYIGRFIEFNIDDLKEHLDCKSYDNFSNFKKRVITTAINEINSKTDMKINVSYVKSGRTFQKIIFEFLEG